MEQESSKNLLGAEKSTKIGKSPQVRQGEDKNVNFSIVSTIIAFHWETDPNLSNDKYLTQLKFQIWKILTN